MVSVLKDTYSKIMVTSDGFPLTASFVLWLNSRYGFYGFDSQWCLVNYKQLTIRKSNCSPLTLMVSVYKRRYQQFSTTYSLMVRHLLSEQELHRVRIPVTLVKRLVIKAQTAIKLAMVIITILLIKCAL